MDDTQEIQRGLGRVEAAISAIRDGYVAHQTVDEREFSEIRRNFAAQDERLATLERLADSVEGHGRAIADIEHRMSNAEERETIRQTRAERDGLWVRWVFFVVLAIAADLFAPRLLNLVGSIIGK